MHNSKVDDSYKRRITFFGNVPQSFGNNALRAALFEYEGVWPGARLPYGNQKTMLANPELPSYIHTTGQVVDELQQQVDYGTATDILDSMKHENPDQCPHNTKQVKMHNMHIGRKIEIKTICALLAITLLITWHF